MSQALFYHSAKHWQPPSTPLAFDLKIALASLPGWGTRPHAPVGCLSWKSSNQEPQSERQETWLPGSPESTQTQLPIAAVTNHHPFSGSKKHTFLIDGSGGQMLAGLLSSGGPGEEPVSGPFLDSTSCLFSWVLAPPSTSSEASEPPTSWSAFLVLSPPLTPAVLLETPLGSHWDHTGITQTTQGHGPSSRLTSSHLQSARSHVKWHIHRFRALGRHSHLGAHFIWPPPFCPVLLHPLHPLLTAGNRMKRYCATHFLISWSCHALGVLSSLLLPGYFNIQQGL